MLQLSVPVIDEPSLANRIFLLPQFSMMKSRWEMTRLDVWQAREEKISLAMRRGEGRG